ncbi:TPA: hypothetical protein SMN65_001646 [Proteus mirabilis]|nr:hypothetical protein [Proteus mirabilis]
MLMFNGKVINFVSIKGFIKTVENNLLGADVSEAVRWIKKYFYPDGYNSIRHRYKGEPIKLLMINGKGDICLAPEKMTNHLLSVAVDFPILFNELCYDRFGFIKEDLECFFESKNINIIFNAISLCDFDVNKNKDKQIEKLKKEIEELKLEISKNKFGSILYLNEFRDDDPLALAIDIRNKEWSSYVHDDKTTRGNQESIILELVNRGLSKKQAESIESVACPIKR